MKWKRIDTCRLIFEAAVLFGLFYLVFQGTYMYQFIDWITLKWMSLISPLPEKAQVGLTAVVGLLSLAVSTQVTYVSMKTRDDKERETYNGKV